jgi:hypothetical protein
MSIANKSLLVVNGAKLTVSLVSIGSMPVGLLEQKILRIFPFNFGSLCKRLLPHDKLTSLGGNVSIRVIRLSLQYISSKFDVNSGIDSSKLLLHTNTFKLFGSCGRVISKLLLQFRYTRVSGRSGNSLREL